MIRRCDKILSDYEEKLHLVERFLEIRTKVQEIRSSTDCPDNIKRIADEIQEDVIMAFESLSEKLQNVFKNLRGKGRLTEADVKAALKEVKIALLEADVSFKVVKQLRKVSPRTRNRTGCDERSESGTDGDQDRKRRTCYPDGI